MATYRSHKHIMVKIFCEAAILLVSYNRDPANYMYVPWVRAGHAQGVIRFHRRIIGGGGFSKIMKPTDYVFST